jgi:hypothetical protein
MAIGNGERSGYAAAFAKFIASWPGSHDSVFVKAFKNFKTCEALSKNLYAGPTSQPAPLKAYPTSGTIFAMRTLSVYANSAITGTDSYYGQLTARNTGNAGYHYRDASQPSNRSSRGHGEGRDPAHVVAAIVERIVALRSPPVATPV